MPATSAFDQESRARSGVPLVRVLARSLSSRLPHAPPASDLAGVGMMTLWAAARRHDPDRSDFTPFLVERLRWAMLSDLRRGARRARLIGRSGRPPVPDAASDAAEAGSNGHAGEPEPIAPGNPEQAAHQVAERMQLRRALSELPPMTRLVLVRHYFGGERLDMLAREFGMSKTAATRLHQSGKRMLAKRLRVMLNQTAAAACP